MEGDSLLNFNKTQLKIEEEDSVDNFKPNQLNPLKVEENVLSRESFNINELKPATGLLLPILRLHRLTKDQLFHAALQHHQKNKNQDRKPTKKKITGDKDSKKIVSNQDSTEVPRRQGQTSESKIKPKLDLEPRSTFRLDLFQKSTGEVKNSPHNKSTSNLSTLALPLSSLKGSENNPGMCLKAPNARLKKSTEEPMKSADQRLVPSQASQRQRGHPKGSRNKPETSVKLSSAVICPDQLKPKVKQEVDELPIGTTSIQLWLNSLKTESCDPHTDGTRGPPKESDPRADARYLGIDTEGVRLRPRDAGGRLRSDPLQPVSPDVLGSNSERRPQNQKVRRFPCPECGLRFFTKVQLESHSRIHTQHRPFSCDVCLKTFSRKGGLDTHRPIHASVKPFACRLCGRAFTFKSNLVRHANLHSDERPHPCPQCGRGFKTSCDLKSHALTHTGHRLHVCSECGRSFKRLMHLKYHCRTHTGERPFACPECPLTFAQRPTLTLHRRQHTGETPYVCADCGRRFKQGSQLKTHVRRRHTGERPYRCPECGKGFVCSGSRNAHAVVHTGERRYRCRECGRGYSQNGALKRHKCRKM